MPLRYITKRAVPVRAYFILLVAALVIPLLVFAGVLLSRYAGVERARSLAEAQAVAVRTADALDRELGGMQVALQVLAASPALVSGDYAAFEQQARMLAKAQGLSLVLLDPDGQQIVNARVAPGTPLGKARDTRPYRLAAEKRQPVVSGLIESANRGIPILMVVVPVLRDRDVSALLSLSVEPARLAQILAEQAAPPGWTLSVIDDQFTVIARSREHERFLGKQATPDLRGHATRGPGMVDRSDPGGRAGAGRIRPPAFGRMARGGRRAYRHAGSPAAPGHLLADRRRPACAGVVLRSRDGAGPAPADPVARVDGRPPSRWAGANPSSWSRRRYGRSIRSGRPW